jgi:hypothetical protein
MRAFRAFLSACLGVLVVAGLAGLVYVDSSRPVSQALVAAPLVTAQASASSVICPRGVTQASDANTKMAMFDPSGNALAGASLLSALVQADSQSQATASFGPLGQQASPLALSTTRTLATKHETSPSSASVVTAKSGSQDAVLAAGSVTVPSGSGTMSGLATMTCLAPVSQAYIVGGSGSTGSSTQLMLANPGQSSVNVAVTLWGSKGVIATPQLNGLVVPPGTQRAVRLDEIGRAHV